MTRLWTCTACAREYAAEPLRCECGGSEFLFVSAHSTADPFGIRAQAEPSRHWQNKDRKR